VFNALPKGHKYNQDYFVQKAVPELKFAKSSFALRKIPLKFATHMDNSMCHNGRKVTSSLAQANVIRAPHPAYSPDLSPCDFWFFGMLKHRMIDRQMQSPEKILDPVSSLWNELTFDDVQKIFLERMERLKWVIQQGGESYINLEYFDSEILSTLNYSLSGKRLFSILFPLSE
jgi:hypothetical protein